MSRGDHIDPSSANGQPPLQLPTSPQLAMDRGLPYQALYTTADAARIFLVTPRAILYLIASGKLVGRDLPGRARFLPQDLEDYLRNSRKEGCQYDPPRVKMRRIYPLSGGGSNAGSPSQGFQQLPTFSAFFLGDPRGLSREIRRNTNWPFCLVPQLLKNCVVLRVLRWRKSRS